LVVGERGGAHQKASLWWRGSAAGKRRWQARVGVTGGVRAVGEEILGGAVLGVGSRGRRRARADYLRWLGSAEEGRWWWSGGAAEATGKEVGEAPGIGAELGAVTESSEGVWGGISRWLNDSSTTA
jgi:hypothetical protein